MLIVEGCVPREAWVQAVAACFGNVQVVCVIIVAAASRASALARMANVETKDQQEIRLGLGTHKDVRLLGEPSRPSCLIPALVASSSSASPKGQLIWSAGKQSR